TVTRFVSVGVDVALADAWRQTCPGCGWQRAGTIAYYGRGVPSLTLAADGRLELIAWTRVGAGPPELRVVRETCAGCGFLTAPPADPLDVAAHSEALPVPEPPVQSEDLGVAVGTNPDGRRELFLRGADGD